MFNSPTWGNPFGFNKPFSGIPNQGPMAAPNGGFAGFPNQVLMAAPNGGFGFHPGFPNQAPMSAPGQGLVGTAQFGPARPIGGPSMTPNMSPMQQAMAAHQVVPGGMMPNQRPGLEQPMGGGRF